MNVGRQVARLRIAHGESLREAAIRTGVSHSTIARIEKGGVTVSFHETLRKIAEGYHVPTDFLLTGEHEHRSHPNTPLRRLLPEERASLLFTSGRERTRRAVTLVTSPRRGGLTREQFATALGIDLATLERMVYGNADLPDELTELLCHQLGLLTGLSPLWFRWGLGEVSAEPPPVDEWVLYMRLVDKSCQAALQPNLVEMAIDLLKLNGGPIPTP